jgi:hypothetical protein
MPILLICLLDIIIPFAAAIRVLMLVKLPGPHPIAKKDISLRVIVFFFKKLLIEGIKISDKSFLKDNEKLLINFPSFKRQRVNFKELLSIANIIIFFFLKFKKFL